jgi:hypothetical protein
MLKRPPGQRPPGPDSDPGENMKPWSLRPLIESLPALHDVNEHCLAVLVQVARKDSPGSLPLVADLRDVLVQLTPEMRARAAQRALLLTDMHLADLPWWKSARDNPYRATPLPTWKGALPRTAALQLARATLVLSWHSLRSHPHNAVLLGVSPAVAELIAALSPMEIDRIVEQRFRHLRPRWEDRPAVWRGLLMSAGSKDFRETRDFNLYGLQLVTGELWSTHPSAPARQP